MESKTVQVLASRQRATVPGYPSCSQPLCLKDLQHHSPLLLLAPSGGALLCKRTYVKRTGEVYAILGFGAASYSGLRINC